jgi:hypothetical protein
MIILANALEKNVRRVISDLNLTKQDKERVVLYKPVLRDHLWENTSSVVRQMTS